MNAVSIKHLNKTYREPAVRDLSLDIRAGEILGLLGPNGAGKTTTIGCLCGLVSFDSGSITIMGHDVRSIEAKRCVGLSEQEPKADPYFSIEQILRYQAGYHGIADVDVERYLEDFGLLLKRRETFRTLSGGMKRKVSIIKALIHDPDILILDEPTAGLDIDSRYELWDFIRSLKDRGKTVLLTTHYIEEAEQLADRIAILHHGSLLALQPTEEMLDEFSMNRIVLFFDKVPQIPDDLDGVVEDSKIIITCPKKDQNATLQRVLGSFSGVRDMHIEQDKLENIFRRFTS